MRIAFYAPMKAPTHPSPSGDRRVAQLLWRALEAGDEDAIYRLYLPICGLVALQMQAGLDGFLAVEKYIMVNRGIFANDYRRRPNAFQLDPETAAEIDRLLDRLQAAIDSAA